MGAPPIKAVEARTGGAGLARTVWRWSLDNANRPTAAPTPASETNGRRPCPAGEGGHRDGGGGHSAAGEVPGPVSLLQARRFRTPLLGRSCCLRVRRPAPGVQHHFRERDQRLHLHRRSASHHPTPVHLLLLYRRRCAIHTHPTGCTSPCAYLATCSCAQEPPFVASFKDGHSPSSPSGWPTACAPATWRPC